MQTTRKLWLCLGAFSTLTVGCTEQKAPQSASPTGSVPATHQEGTPGRADLFEGDFPGAVSKLLAGEGGEGGLGTYFDKGKLVIPPLDGPQIEQALTGNTLRRKNSFAVHFEPAGKFSGLEWAFKPADPARCQNGKPPQYLSVEGTCYQRHETTVPTGSWSTRDGKLCTTPALVSAADGEECVAIHLAFNSVVLVKSGDVVVGKGNELVKGKQLESEM